MTNNSYIYVYQPLVLAVVSSCSIESYVSKCQSLGLMLKYVGVKLSLLCVLTKSCWPSTCDRCEFGTHHLLVLEEVLRWVPSTVAVFSSSRISCCSVPMLFFLPFSNVNVWSSASDSLGGPYFQNCLQFLPFAFTLYEQGWNFPFLLLQSSCSSSDQMAAS